MTDPETRAHLSGQCSRLPRCLRSFATGLLVCAFASFSGLRAQAPPPTEYEVQAAYLSNFGRFVEWPARTGAIERDPFYVCVLGQDPFGSLLDAALKGEAIGGAPMAARRVTSAADAASCRIVFVNSTKDSELKGILAILRNFKALTVSDTFDFTRQGGMIQFVLEGNRVRFEINLAAAQRAGLTLSSQLLKVAVAIRRAP
jgi:YfiR/HmsC-like